jgi:NADH dehydrogenase FAD-containing subunit
MTPGARTRPRVVIVGAGFAGLEAAGGFGGGYDVTVIDRGADFEFLPNLHELVSRTKKPGALRLARRRLVERRGHRFRLDEVVAIEPDRRLVRTGDGDGLAYDVLVMATGSAARTAAPGAARHALALRSIAEGVAIGERLRQLAQRGGRGAVTIVGGGFTGVECLGEVLRRYRQRRGLTVRLIEPGRRLLASQPAAVGRAVRAVAEECDVELLLGESVAEVEAERVRLASGSWLRSDLTLWTAGGGPPPLLAQAGLAPAGEWAPAAATLQSRAWPDVFIAGDSAGLRRGVAKQSYQAAAMGRRAARNARRLLAGRELRRFSPLDTQLLITFGFLTGFYVDDDVVVEGAVLCLARELLFQAGMAELDRPRRRGARRRLLRRLRGAARLAALPGPLRAVLPHPFARAPRDRFDLPALPRVLAWRDAEDGLAAAAAGGASAGRVAAGAGRQGGGLLLHLLGRHRSAMSPTSATSLLSPLSPIPPDSLT